MDITLPGLLTSLTDSLESAILTLPEDESSILPPKDGISLLDVKNELFLSYLQNLVFLIILKIRTVSAEGKIIPNDEETQSLHDEVVKKLVELRVYLEKGVRPLESRLKYQIDKVLRAAEDSRARSAAQKQLNGTSTKKRAKANAANRSDEGDSEASEEDSEDEHSDAKSSASSASSAEDIDELSYRPNPAAFIQPKSSAATKSASTAATGQEDSGIYRPPRINPTALPTTDHSQPQKPCRTPRSATLDEYIMTELSTTPAIEPSIGSTIAASGRRNKLDRERRDEAERQAYEEANFVRLPKESKAEMKRKGGGRGIRDGGYGGEEWRGLGEGVDRIERLTQRKTVGALEKSRKRAVEDRPRGSGVGDGVRIGERFEKRRRVVSRRRK